MYTQLFKCVRTNDISFINASRREIRRRFLSHVRPDLLQKRLMTPPFLKKTHLGAFKVRFMVTWVYLNKKVLILIMKHILTMKVFIVLLDQPKVFHN